MHSEVNEDGRCIRVLKREVLAPCNTVHNGWMAQPGVRLFDRSEGSFAPREQVVDCKP